MFLLESVALCRTWGLGIALLGVYICLLRNTVSMKMSKYAYAHVRRSTLLSKNLGLATGSDGFRTAAEGRERTRGLGLKV